MQLMKSKQIAQVIVNGIFLIVLNIALMAIIGYLTLDSNANNNSRFGAYLLSFLIPFFIVVKTQELRAIERMLKFGMGFIVYLVISFFSLEIPTIILTGLGPCLFISLSVLLYGEDLLGITKIEIVLKPALRCLFQKTEVVVS